MKANLFVVFLLLFILVGCTSQQSDQLTQQQKEQIKNDVKTVYDRFLARWMGLDPEGAMEYYSQEVVIVSDTSLIDYQTYKKEWNGLNSVAVLKTTPIQINYLVLTKDVVICTWLGNVEYLMKSGDKTIFNPIKYTDVWRKVGEQWKIFYEHTSGIQVETTEKK